MDYQNSQNVTQRVTPKICNATSLQTKDVYICRCRSVNVISVVRMQIANLTVKVEFCERRLGPHVKNKLSSENEIRVLTLTVSNFSHVVLILFCRIVSTLKW